MTKSKKKVDKQVAQPQSPSLDTILEEDELEQDEVEPCDPNLVPLGNDKPVTEKANGKQFIRERPKLPASTIKPEVDDDNEESDEEVIEARNLRKGPRVNYTESEVPDDDHYLCKFIPNYKYMIDGLSCLP